MREYVLYDFKGYIKWFCTGGVYLVDLQFEKEFSACFKEVMQRNA